MSNPVQSYIDENGRKILYGYEDEISAVSNETLEDWREGKKRKQLATGPVRAYVNCYHDSVKELSEQLAVQELGAAMKLIPYIKFDSGGRLHYEGKRMTATNIAKVIRKSKSPTDRIIKALVDVGFLVVEREGKFAVYNVSEKYHVIGYNVRHEYFTKVYQVKTRTDIDNLSIQAAGLLYKIIPYFNYEWCCLCENPEEKDIERINYLSNRQVADLLGVDRKFIDRYAKELSKFGFMMKVAVYDIEMFYVNPDVMYRKKDEYTDHAERLRSIFRMGESCSQQMAGVKISELPF